MYINGLDDKDNQIIALLREDGRMSATDIGKRVGLSRTAVTNRITELQSRGIIQGFTVVLNPHKDEKTKTFMMYIETTPDAFDGVVQTLKESKNIVTLCQVSGDCVLEAVAVVEDIDEMRFFARKLRLIHTTGLVKLSALGVWDVMKGNILPI